MLPPTALSQQKFLAAGEELQSFAPGFPAYGILLNNDTGNWLSVNGTFIVPPWTYGWSQPLPGTNSVSVTILPGPSIIPSASLGTYVTLLITAERLPQSNGFTAVTSASLSASVTIAGPVAVTGTVGISGGVDVSGSNVNAVITNSVAITGSVSITGSVTIGNTVDVSGSTVTATVSNTVTISGSVTVTSGSITVAGSVSISGGVTITSGTIDIGTVAGTVTITGTISNTVDVNVTSSVSVSSVGGTVTVAGTINIGNTPSVSISGTPSVNIASGTVSISGSVTVGTITAGNVQITPGTFTAGGQGVTKVAVTGTAVQLKSTTAIKVLIIKARSANAGTLYLGKSTVTNDETAGTGGLQLDPGDMVTFTDVDTANIYINGTAGDGVSYMYWI